MPNRVENRREPLQRNHIKKDNFIFRAHDDNDQEFLSLRTLHSSANKNTCFSSCYARYNFNVNDFIINTVEIRERVNKFL